MDDFKKAGARAVGPGGIKCPCCFDYRKKKRKLPGWSKLRRTRLKEKSIELINEEVCQLTEK